MIRRCRVCGTRHIHFSYSTERIDESWVWTETCDNCGTELERFVMKA